MAKPTWRFPPTGPVRLALVWGLFLMNLALPVSAAQMTFLPITVDFPQMMVKAKVIAIEPLNLASNAFQIWEDDVPVPEVSVFQATARQSLTLLLDRSSSLENVIGEVKRSAAGFVEALPPEVKLSMVSFASDIDINQDFTFDKKAVLHAISQVRAWGGTVLYDASCLAIEQLHYNSDPRDLKTLILFTDGRDETPVGRKQMSTKDFADVLAQAERHKIRIVPVALGTEIDEEKLKEMARRTGGFYLHAPTVNELFGVYQKLAQRMKMEHIFNLGYFSPHPQKDGKKHRLKIACRVGEQVHEREMVFEAPWDPRQVERVAPEPKMPVRPAVPLNIAPPDLPAMPILATATYAPASSPAFVPQTLDTTIRRDAPVGPKP